MRLHCTSECLRLAAPAAAPAASPASPPAQASLPLSDSPASPPTALLDSIPRDLFSDAWDAPEPPAPDPAAPDLPGADADPGPAHEDFGDGDPPDDEDIA
ncbi:MAG: hypothetical protein IT452_02950 [Planctomycetia bacterium]|nr:hypothetical protein [Planctomycetia bacterium]